MLGPLPSLAGGQRRGSEQHRELCSSETLRVTGLASLQQKRFTRKSGEEGGKRKENVRKRRERKKVAREVWGRGRKGRSRGLRTEVRQPLPHTV